MPTIGDLNVRIGAKTESLNKGLSQATNSVKSQGAMMTKLATSASAAIALAFLGAGVAGTRMAVDIETAFSKIENLVGVTGSTLDGFKDSVKDVSTQTGKSQGELSEALFTITSAGMQGATAMEVLTQAAKASAIGMGETKAIAQATAAVLTAYGTESMSAGKAIDTMTAIVRAGNLEASSLAPALGRVVGIAAQVGVSFEELGANVAAFTRLGVSADEAITGLRGLLNGIIKPTKESAEALASVGLTFDELRAQIREKGLSYALNNLVALFGDNTEGLSRLIPSVEALANVLGTAGAQGAMYAQIAGDIAASTGIVDNGFANVSETVQSQFNVALARTQAIMMDFGNRMLPIVSTGLSALNDVLGLFSRQTQEITANNFELIKSQGDELKVLEDLSARYTELKSNTNLTAGEKRELTTVTLELKNLLGESAGAINTETGQWELNRAELIRQIQTRAALQSDTAQAILAERAQLQKLQDDREASFKGLQNLLELFPKTLREAQYGWSNVSQATRDAEGSTAAVVAEYQRLKAESQAGGFGAIESQIAALDKQLTDLGLDWDALNSKVSKPITPKGGAGGGGGGGTSTTKAEAKEVKNLVTGYVELSGALSSAASDYDSMQAAIAGMMGLKVQTDLDEQAASLLKVYQAMFTLATGLPMLDTAVNATTANLTEMTVSMGSMLEPAIQQFMAGIGAMAAGTGTFGDVILGLLGSVIGFAEQLGDAMIATGMAGIALKLVFAQPWMAVAAGLALKLFAGIAGGIMKDGPAPPALAQGGLAFGPTLAMVGDNPGARSNPEVIAPLDKLMAIMGAGGGGGGEMWARLTGEDLLLSTERASSRIGRIKG